MKTKPIKIHLLAVVACFAPVVASGKEVREAPSAEAVTAARGNIAASYGNSKTAKKGAPVEVVTKRPTLADQSDYLVGAYGYTILPKGAVTYTGSAVKLSATQPTTGKLMNWDSFYRKHRAGLRLVAITDSQWTGTAPLDSLKPALDAASKSNITTLISLNGYPVGLPKIKSLLLPTP